MTRRMIDQEGQFLVNCCVCLNVSGTRVPATTMFDRYLLCDEHADIASQDFARVIWTYEPAEEEVAAGS